MSVDDHTVLAAALDVMLPGDGEFPSASDIGLAERMLGHPVFAEATRGALALLPTDLAARDGIARTAAIAALESGSAAVFDRFVTAAYSAYYTTQPALDAVERTSGYAARPPQPIGYVLQPFDPAVLAIPASRPPSYRTVPKSDSAS